MQASADIRAILDKAHIHYEVLEHPPAFTAMEIAEAQHIVGQQVIKAVIVKVDGKLGMCVLPAIHVIDFAKLKAALKAKDVHLETESKVAMLFPTYEVGAMPPFGHLAGLTVYLDKSLEENDTVAFNAGSHREMLRIKFKDYLRLVKPTLIDFGMHISHRSEP